MNTMAKKLLLLLLTLGFLTTQVWAQDDDYYYDDEEEEEEDVKKTSKEVSKRAVSSSSAAKRVRSNSRESRDSRDSKESKDSRDSRGDADGFKVGFYGSIVTSGMSSIGELGLATGSGKDALFNLTAVRAMGHVGALFNLGSDLELGLGLGFSRFSEEESYPGGTIKNSITIYEIVPGVYYQLGKGDLVSYGPGLDFHLASWSIKADDPTYDDELDGFNFAFFPNFQLKAEIVKDFQVWLKTGLMLVIPATDEEGDTKTSSMAIGLKTSIGISFYL